MSDLDVNDAADESETRHGADHASPVEPADTMTAAADDTPTVDELESRLRDLQGAMDQLQSGELDAAEQAIESLEGRMNSTRD